jgi:hypothetical protein
MIILAYLSFGQSCLTLGSLPCNTALGLICDVSTQTCLCPSLTYWSYAGCESVSTYSGYCDQNATCNTQAGLFCRLPGLSPACDCTQGLARTTTTRGINSISSCMNQTTYHGNCRSNSQCPQTLNLVCVG